ncbi:MAG: transglycosylase family protein, partial [Dehalococcoidia bacterium]
LAIVGATELVGRYVEVTARPLIVSPVLEQRELRLLRDAPKPKATLSEDDIDRVLVRAVRVRQAEIRELVFQMSRTDFQVAPVTSAPVTGAAAPVGAPRAEAAPPAVHRPPPVIVGHDHLMVVLERFFPEVTETAYAIVICESSANVTANTGNGYYGLWQFDLATWQSVGGVGLPSDASMEEQVQRARMLYDARGWQPWGCH